MKIDQNYTSPDNTLRNAPKIHMITSLDSIKLTIKKNKLR